MDGIILKYAKGGYSKESDIGNGLIHLSPFFDDIGCDSIDSWKEWFNDTKTTHTGSNYSTIIKSGNKINIYFEYDYFEHDEDAESFETTVEQMNYILDCWKEVCEKKPKRFIITRDGDKVTCTMEME